MMVELSQLPAGENHLPAGIQLLLLLVILLLTQTSCNCFNSLIEDASVDTKDIIRRKTSQLVLN